ncbi:(2Fe-2S)-binding protein [Candidatus Peregrinibacteria bacterium]|nr:(2Fe-2S)-binding protein [Candidatus Peregrinibacteria bacterium]
MPKVKFSNTGDEVEVETGAALKDVTKDNGWPIAYGCEDGVCGTCIIEVEEGAENVSPMEETEDQTLDMMCMKEGGKHRLCCQCKVNGDVKIKGM